MKRALTTAMVLGAVVCLSGAARATSCNPCSTGVDDNGIIDQAWSLVGGTAVLGTSGGPTTTVTFGPSSPVYTNSTNGVFPVNGYWVVNIPGVAQWDTPFNPLNSNTDPLVNGTYVFQTTFTSLGSQTLGLLFAVDNAVTAVTLNGNPIPTGAGTDGSFTPLTIATLPGTDTLQFDVVNFAQSGGNPSGLDVDFLNQIGGISTTPLPSTWTMLLAGFLGLGFVAYRGSKNRAVAGSVVA